MRFPDSWIHFPPEDSECATPNREPSMLCDLARACIRAG